MSKVPVVPANEWESEDGVDDDDSGFETFMKIIACLACVIIVVLAALVIGTISIFL